MKRSAVRLSVEQRRLACSALVEALRFHETEVVDLSVSATHFHALCRFMPWEQGERSPRGGARGLSNPKATSNRSPRHVIGLAKSWAAKALKDAGHFDHTKIWARRSQTVPVESRAHQLRVVRYIREHGQKEGAAVWSMWS